MRRMVPSMTEQRSDTPEVPAKDWPWWWSMNEERYHGPCDSRADAILEAWADQAGEGEVFILQATQEQNLCTDIFRGDRLAEMFDDANEEVQDPDGDGLSCDIKDHDWSALATRLNNIMATFIREHGLQSWAFANQTRAEVVNLSVNAERMARLEAALAAAGLEVPD